MKAPSTRLRPRAGSKRAWFSRAVIDRAWFSRAAKETRRLDLAVYAAIAVTPTPSLDTKLGRLSHLADHSRLSIASAALLALFGGPRGREASKLGLGSVAVTSAVLNLGVKPLVRRRRPDRAAQHVPRARHIRMPSSTAFPSGHSAAAFAFATGVGHALPAAGFPLRTLAALVAYSRVHTGVHYPGDVIAGALLGGALAQATSRAMGGGTGTRPHPGEVWSTPLIGARPPAILRADPSEEQP